MPQVVLNIENIVSDQLSPMDFERYCLSIFQHQYQSNEVYRSWVHALKIKTEKVRMMEDIPFLPIEFFKSHKVICSPHSDTIQVFTSSATTSQIPAKHYVSDCTVYERSFITGFERAYGPVTQYCILALLPSYLQRSGSSLVYMCDRLIKDSGHPLSGFFLDNTGELLRRIQALRDTRQKVILLGVSYALLDLCEKKVRLSNNFTVMETGGMKGKRKELLKRELHELLKRGFGIDTIHSEYGMTELLSQAYSKGEGCFEAPPWMKFVIREVEDPLNLRNDHKTGGINIIDLANINSCSFIASKDLGLINAKGQLELMGRYDHSDVRGCNLMFTNS